MTSQQQHQHQRRSNKLSMDYVSIGCCTLAFGLYVNTLGAGFVYDDRYVNRVTTGHPGSTTVTGT